MKKIITALFVLWVTLSIGTTAFAAEADNCIKEFLELQMIDFPTYNYIVDDESDDPLLYRVMEQQKAMAEEATFNPGTFTKDLLLNGAKIRTNLDQSTSGKHFVDIYVYKETSNTEDIGVVKWSSSDTVTFTVFGNSSINWRIELPF